MNIYGFINAIAKASISAGGDVGDVGGYVLDNKNAYGPSEYDQFGFSVAINDTYVAVGAPFEGDAGWDYSGRVYIYDTLTGDYIFSLDNDGGSLDGVGTNDQFGYSVAMSDDFFVVGVVEEEGISDEDAGTLQVFDLTGIKVEEIWNPDMDVLDDRMGASCVINNNNIIAAGADDGSDDIGKVFVFSLNSSGSSSHLHTLANPSPAVGDHFGFPNAIGINNTHIAIGAWGVSLKVYIYDILTGNLVHTILNENHYGDGLGDEFGYAIDMTDDYLVISAPFEDFGGIVYVYETSTWTLVQTLTNPDVYDTPKGDGFGWSVAINDDFIAVGAINEDDAGGADSGIVFVYDTLTWSLQYTFTNPNTYDTSYRDRFGYKVKLSNSNHLIVSTPWSTDGTPDSDNSGIAYVYKLD